MAEGKPHVPAEFAGKADSPEAAAEIVADVVGLGTGPLRAEHHRELAEAEGRGEDAAFYAEMRDILLRWADES